MDTSTHDHDRIHALAARAEAGDTEAMFTLGRLHDLPEKPEAPLDLATARAWYQRAADLGHGWSQFALANMHDRAEAGSRNHHAARQWYEAAAKQGIAEAQMQFGRMLQTGRGGPADLPQAAHWYELAAQQGHELAATNLALMHLANEAPQPDLRKACELLEFAADKLDGLAHLVLGDVHLHGMAGKPHGGLALVHYCVATMLLPPGPDAERATTAKDGLLSRQPDLRDQYEGHAREFIAARTVPAEPAGTPAPLQ